MNIGKFRVTPLEFGKFKLDGGAMFGVVPRILWEKYYPADENNRIEMSLRCLLIEIDDRKILIDTGFGEGRSQRFRDIYAYTGSDNYLEESLSQLGIKFEQITDVMLTHLHFDHGGGSTINKASDPAPAFPNAKYYIQKKQLEHARSRMERDRASYLPEDFEPLINAKVAEIKDGYWELMPGIDVIICNGHTPAMQLVRVKDAGETMVFAADLIPLSAQFALPWIMAYDLYPVTTLEEKKSILAQAVAENWVFAFEHDPYRVFGKVKKTARGFQLSEE